MKNLIVGARRVRRAGFAAMALAIVGGWGVSI
jgi:hypothetical protein